MYREKFIEIMDGDSKLSEYSKCTALLGLNLIAKYLPKSGVEAANHDIIYACDVDQLLDAGITEEDAIELRNMNWMIDEDCDCLACFV